jgi:hypothetical protein
MLHSNATHTFAVPVQQEAIHFHFPRRGDALLRREK